MTLGQAKDQLRKEIQDLPGFKGISIGVDTIRVYVTIPDTLVLIPKQYEGYLVETRLVNHVLR